MGFYDDDYFLLFEAYHVNIWEKSTLWKQCSIHTLILVLTPRHHRNEISSLIQTQHEHQATKTVFHLQIRTSNDSLWFHNSSIPWVHWLKFLQSNPLKFQLFLPQNIHYSFDHLYRDVWTIILGDLWSVSFLCCAVRDWALSSTNTKNASFNNIVPDPVCYPNKPDPLLIERWT